MYMHFVCNVECFHAYMWNVPFVARHIRFKWWLRVEREREGTDQDFKNSTVVSTITTQKIQDTRILFPKPTWGTWNSKQTLQFLYTIVLNTVKEKKPQENNSFLRRCRKINPDQIKGKQKDVHCTFHHNIVLDRKNKRRKISRFLSMFNTITKQAPKKILQ